MFNFNKHHHYISRAGIRLRSLRGQSSTTASPIEPPASPPLASSLLTLTEHLRKFVDSSRAMDDMRHRYGSAMYMSPDERARFDTYKAYVIGFNDILRDVVASGAKEFTFDSLIEHMVHAYCAKDTSRQDCEDFRHRATTTLVGARNEVAFEQLLRMSGYNFSDGDDIQDAHGGDYIVEGVPLDVKASQFGVQKALEREHAGGFDDENILWSHIQPEDFNGQLTLPQNRAKEILLQLKPDVAKILRSHHAVDISRVAHNSAEA